MWVWPQRGMCGKSSAAALARERATTPALAALALHAPQLPATELLLPLGRRPCEPFLASHDELQLAAMDPPNRSKNSAPSPSIASSHAASGSQQPSSMAPSARTARGSTPTASRSATKLADDKTATRPASRDSLKQKMAKKPEEGSRPNKSDEVSKLVCIYNGTGALPANAAQQLKTLKTDFDSLRSHLTCKICDRMLYQPYTIACGHTYCYTVSTPA
jgi:hypothetical protein